MSRIPTDLTHDLTCLLKASNLSPSQVTGRPPVDNRSAERADKSGSEPPAGADAAPRRLSCCVRRFRASPARGAGCEAGPEVRAMPACTPPKALTASLQDSCTALASAKDCSDTGNRQGPAAGIWAILGTGESQWGRRAPKRYRQHRGGYRC